MGKLFGILFMLFIFFCTVSYIYVMFFKKALKSIERNDKLETAKEVLQDKVVDEQIKEVLSDE